MPPKKSIPSKSRNHGTASAQLQPTRSSAAQAAPVAAQDERTTEQPSQSDDGGLDLQEGGSGSLGNGNKAPRSVKPLFSPQQLAGMSKEQLRVIVMGLQTRSNAPRQSSGAAGGSRTHTPAQSFKRKHTAISGGSVGDGSDEDGDDEDDEFEEGIEDGDEDEDGGEGGGAKEGGTSKKIEKLITKHVRRSICTAGGWKHTHDVNETRFDSDGNPVFFFRNKQGVELISPVWEQSFEQNWQNWGPHFIRQCRDQAGIGTDAAILKQVSDDQFRENLKLGVWRTIGRYGRQKNRGDFEEHQVARAARVRHHSNQRRVSGRRSKSRAGTCVEDKKFNWLFNVKCQSRASSDSEDTGRSIFLEPAWRNPMVTRVYDALDQKARLNGASSQKTVVHRRVDTLPVVLGNNERYPFWALDPKWVETHPTEFEGVEFMFNKADTVMPNFDSLLEQYKCPGRTYITQLPARLPVPAIPVAPARSTSPSGTIDLRSVSPPAPVQERSSPPQPPRLHLHARLPPGTQPPLDQAPQASRSASLSIPHPDQPVEGAANAGSSCLLPNKGPDEGSLRPVMSVRASMRRKKKAKTDTSAGGNSGAPVVKEEREPIGRRKKDKVMGK